MKIAKLEDYELLKTSDGWKTERFGPYILKRPDPQIIWKDEANDVLADAEYIKEAPKELSWKINNTNMPKDWLLNYENLKIKVKLMNFKHIGIFPEQQVNWELLKEILTDTPKKVKVLNLFGFTGAASLVALKYGAEVVHVDASSPAVEWCKDNIKLNNLEDKPIRYIVDDCLKFVKREVHRGNKYDIIIMDPPTFGRGSSGQVWNIEKNLYDLINLCSEILSEKPLLFLVNIYNTFLSKKTVENILKKVICPKFQGIIENYELGLKVKNKDIDLASGSTILWKFAKK